MRKILLALTTTTAALIAVGAVPGAAAADAPDGEWAVLGDSYTAGYFAGDQLEPRDGCLRTNGAYPVVAHAAARPDLVLRNVSCVGAETKNVWESQVPPAGTDPVAPQIEALSDRTEVVTIGLGGNSFGFGPVLTKCLALGIAVSEKPGTPCTTSYGADVAGGRLGDELEQRMQQVLTEYGTMLEAVHDAAPNARIVTVGYPQLAPADPSTCTWKEPTQFSFVTRSDLPFFKLAEDRLNLGIAAQSIAHGITHVDPTAASTGNDVCADPASRWIEGLRSADDTDTLVHPTLRGHAGMADLVADAVLAG
ncbi:SGNH/GDSL hydrolase family protein [Curtobacterium sp. PhB136]|uniref:SGNH/GDSL hydrolase family protein n=1 Tax=Curtobacterium sp. PhB136 TaxID=2485181 RepID=UPI00104F8C91|nr:SGNH/GDSL hydrolase family protein [Curtobacterium sp. PhB136]TCK65379.1 GDSL-like lipase/acylhydrolase family protein [Curtobacterium sp. PhB136]